MESKLREHSCVVLLVCLALLVQGCSQARVASSEVLTDSPDVLQYTYTSPRDDAVGTLELVGRIVPAEEVTIHFGASGLVQHVYVRPGDRVSAGNLLVQLETDELLSQIAQAEIALDSAQQLLSEAEESRQQAIEEAKLDLAATQAKLTQAQEAQVAATLQAELSLLLAQEQLARTQGLQARYAAEVVSARVGLAEAQDVMKRAQVAHREALERPWEQQSIREALARELEQAQRNLEVAQSQYDEAIADGEIYRRDIKIEGIAIEQAQAEVERLKTDTSALPTLEVQRAQQQLEWLERSVSPVLANDVTRAQLALAELKLRLEKTELRAPSDGTVIEVSVRPGDTVVQRQAAVLLADLEHFYLETAALSQFDIAQVNLDQQVQVTLDAFPDVILAGRVHEIALQDSDLLDDQVTYAVRVSIGVGSHASLKPRWGMSGIVHIP